MKKLTHDSVERRRKTLIRAEHGPDAGGLAGGGLRVALVYPHTYHVGMSSLGFQIVYQMINGRPGARAERFFTDTMAQGSIETGAALGDFDLIAVSGAYEMDDPHVLDVIEAAGLPLEARRRCPEHGWPLVAVGGVLVSVNRLPLYPFVDLFCHGEAELLIPTLIERMEDSRRGGRAELLDELGRTPGFEVTAGARAAAGLELSRELEPLVDVLDQGAGELGGVGLPRPAAPESAIMPVLGKTPFTSHILTPHTEFSNMALVDLARGCPHHCTFCWIGHNAPTYRARPMEDILEAVARLQPHTDRFGLVASAVGAHPQIDEICAELMRRELKISYSSLRVEEVSDTMLRALAAGGGKTVTIAPEAGHTRVRKLLGKRISDEQIFEVTEKIFGLGAENLKMYFMIGVPSETDEEALEIAAFTEKIRRIQLRWARPRGRVGTIGINLGVFVPKPRLPLNHIEPVALAAIRKRLKRLVQALGRIPNTQVNVSSPDLARAQAVLSMGGVEAARYVMLVRELGGNWRQANRQWGRFQDKDYVWRPDEPPRLAGRALRAHSGVTAAP